MKLVNPISRHSLLSDSQRGGSASAARSLITMWISFPGGRLVQSCVVMMRVMRGYLSGASAGLT